MIGEVHGVTGRSPYEAVEAGAISDHQLECIRRVEHILGELLRQPRQLLNDGGIALALR